MESLSSLGLYGVEQRELLQQLSDVVIATDLNFVVCTFNKAAEDMYGFPAGEILGRELASMIKYDFGNTSSNKALRQLEADGSWQGRVSFARNDGVVVQFLANVKYIHDSSGERIGIVAVHKNITDLVATQKKSVQYRRMLQSVLNGTNEALFLIDANFKLLLYNDNSYAFIQKFLGKQLHQHDNFIELFPLRRQKIIRRGIEKALRGENFEYEVQYPQNLWAFVSFAWVVNEFTNEREVCIAARDITQKKAVLEEVKMLSLLAKDTVNGVMITDAHGVITWVNQSFVKLYGYSEKELTGKHLPLVFTGPETNMKTLRQIDEHVKKGKVFDCEVASYKKNGERTWVRMDMQPIFGDGKKLARYLVMLTDMTEQLQRKQIEIAVKVEHQKQINRAILKTQEEFSNSLGRELHDNINQILTASKLQLEFASSGKELDQTLYNKGISNIQKAIDEIRSLSKQLASPYFAEKDFLKEVNALIENMHLSDKVCLDTHGFIDFQCCPELKLHLFRILQEQLKNIVRHARAQTIHIVLQIKNDALRLVIQDDGIGFDTKLSKDGIGLANIRSRVELFNGTMKIDSAPGKGCRLFVNFRKVS